MVSAKDISHSGQSGSSGTRRFRAGSPFSDASRQDLAAEQSQTDLISRDSFRYRALLGTLSDMYFVLRKDGIIAEFQSPEDCDYSLCASVVVGKSVRDLLPTQLAQQILYRLEKALRTNE